MHLLVHITVPSGNSVSRKGAKFLEYRIILLDRPKNLNFAPSFGNASVSLRGWLKDGSHAALWVMIGQRPH